MSKFVGVASYAPTCFFDLMDDNVESDGSSIGGMAPSHRPSQECAMADAPGQPPVATQSLQTHAPLDPHAENPELACEHGEEPMTTVAAPATDCTSVLGAPHGAPCA